MHGPVGAGDGLPTEFDHGGRGVGGIDVHALRQQRGGQESGTGAELIDAGAAAERSKGGEGLRKTLLGRGMGVITLGSFVKSHGFKG